MMAPRTSRVPFTLLAVCLLLVPVAGGGTGDAAAPPAGTRVGGAIAASAGNLSTRSIDGFGEVLTSYTGSYRAGSRVEAASDLPMPLLRVQRNDRAAAPPGGEYLSVWPESPAARWRVDGTELRDLYARGWLLGGSSVGTGEEFGFALFHGHMVLPSPAWLPASPTKGTPQVLASATLVQRMRTSTVSGGMQAAVLAVAGYVRFSGGDVVVNGGESVALTHSFALPPEASDPNITWSAGWRWGQPPGTTMGTSLRVDLNNSEGTFMLNLTGGRFPQTRDSDRNHGFPYYGGVPFFLYIVFYKNVVGGSGSPPFGSAFGGSLTGGHGYERSGEASSVPGAGPGSSRAAAPQDSIQTSGGGEYRFTFVNNYLGTGFPALTDITPYPFTTPLVRAVAVPFVVVNSTAVRLDAAALVDSRTVRGRYTGGYSRTSGGLPAVPGSAPTVDDGASFSYSPSGSTVVWVLIANGTFVTVTAAFSSSGISVSAEAASLDGANSGRTDYRILFFADPAADGKVFYGTTSGNRTISEREWTLESSGVVETASGTATRIRFDGNTSISLYGSTSGGGTGYALVGGAALSSDPASLDDNERLGGKNTVAYYEAASTAQAHSFSASVSLVPAPAPPVPSPDIAVTGLSVAPAVGLDEAAPVQVSLANMGGTAMNGTVALFEGTLQLGAWPVALAPAETAVVTTEWTPSLTGAVELRAEVIPYGGNDAVPDNNFAARTVAAGGGVQCALLAPYASQKVRGTVPVKASVTGHAITSVNYQIGDGAWAPMLPAGEGTYQASWDTTTVVDGRYVLAVKAVNSYGSSGTATVQVVVENHPVTYGVLMTADAGVKEVEPGKRAAFNITVKNTGTTFDTIYLEIRSGLYGASARLDPPSLGLEAGDTGKSHLYITVPADATEGTTTITVIAESASSSSAFDSEDVTMRVRRAQVVQYGLSFDAQERAKGVRPGKSVQFLFNLTNRGSRTEAFDVKAEFAGQAGGTITYSLLPGVVTCDAGANVTVTLTVHVPATAEAGDVIVRVTAAVRDHTDVKKDATVTLSITTPPPTPDERGRELVQFVMYQCLPLLLVAGVLLAAAYFVIVRRRGL